MEMFILGYEWLNMANEMGNSNVSGVREKEKTTVEAQENSCQTANHADDVRGKNQIKQEGEVKDFHEKVEGCSFYNPPGIGYPPVAKHTLDGKEEVEASSSTFSAESRLHNAEPLESESNNEDEHSEPQMDPLQEGHEALPLYQAEDKENLLDTEEERKLDETAVSDAKIDEEKRMKDFLVKETMTTLRGWQSGLALGLRGLLPPKVSGSNPFASKLLGPLGVMPDRYFQVPGFSRGRETMSRENLLGTSITNDQCETATKDEMENGFGRKRSEEVPAEVKLSRNGSSKAAEQAFSQATSSNTFEEVPQIQDKSMIPNRNKETIESMMENEVSKQVVKESNTGEVSTTTSQHELMMVGSDSGSGKENVENRELTEMTPIMEIVPTESPSNKECNHEEEETEQTKEKIIEATQEKAENYMPVGIRKEERKKPELDTRIFQSAGNEAVDNAVYELRKSPRFNFELSMEARFEESDQTHNNKTRTRRLLILDGATGFGNLVQNQAVSAEEKSTEVERRNSNELRAPFLIFLMKDEEMGNVAVKLKTQDCEKKGVEETWTGATKEVALITRSVKRKPRPSLLPCIRRAVEIS